MNNTNWIRPTEAGCSPVKVIAELPARWDQRQKTLGKRRSAVAPGMKSQCQPNGTLFARSHLHLLFAAPAAEPFVGSQAGHC